MVMKRPDVSLARRWFDTGDAPRWGCNGGAAPLAKMVRVLPHTSCAQRSATISWKMISSNLWLGEAEVGLANLPAQRIRERS